MKKNKTSAAAAAELFYNNAEEVSNTAAFIKVEEQKITFCQGRAHSVDRTWQTFYVCSSTYREVVDNSNHIKI